MLKTVGFPSIRTGDQTIVDGNLVIGTAGKGIDFSATPGTGTSELLSDYEEGTWTPTPVGITVVSGTPVYTGKYTRIGRQVMLDIAMTNLSGTITVAAANSFGNLPFTSATTSWGVYGDPGNAGQGGFCTVSGASVYLATANTYINYFSLAITYSV
jgi:hypothetical protein